LHRHLRAPEHLLVLDLGEVAPEQVALLLEGRDRERRSAGDRGVQGEGDLVGGDTRAVVSGGLHRATAGARAATGAGLGATARGATGGGSAAARAATARRPARGGGRAGVGRRPDVATDAGVAVA